MYDITTVAELISALQKMPQGAIVEVKVPYDDDYKWDTCLEVESLGKKVLIYG